MICWKCREPIETLVCVSCGAIQPPPAQPNYFKILGLSQSYFIDLEELSAAHRMVSKLVHPDRFRQRSAVERRMSLQWSAAVNEAKRVLVDPLLRARYLATGSATVSETETTNDQQFLEHIFELQMQAMSEPENAKERAQAELQRLCTSLELDFRAWEAQQGTLEHISQELIKWSYLTKLIDRI